MCFEILKLLHNVTSASGMPIRLGLGQQSCHVPALSCKLELYLCKLPAGPEGSIVLFRPWAQGAFLYVVQTFRTLLEIEYQLYYCKFNIF